MSRRPISRKFAHSAHRSRAARRPRTVSERRWQALGGFLRRVRLVALAAGAAVAVGAFAIVLTNAVPASGSPTGNHAASPQAPNWVSLASTSPADVLKAARATPEFQDVYNSPQTLAGQALRTGTLATPVLVHVYRPTPGLLDVYVIPVVAPALAPTGSHIAMLLDFGYDQANARLHAQSFAGPFVPSDPNYGQPFPRESAQQAQVAFAAQHPAAQPSAVHQDLGSTVGLAAATAVAKVTGTPVAPVAPAAASSEQTELVYFPVNLDQLNNQSHPLSWTAGGQFPDLAVWRIVVPGSPDTIMGVDGRSYSAAQLPLAPGAAPASGS